MKRKPSDNELLQRTEDGKLVPFVIGGKKAAATNKKRHGAAFYERIGSMGGKISRGGGFAAATPEQRAEWGRKGGKAYPKK